MPGVVITASCYKHKGNGQIQSHPPHSKNTRIDASELVARNASAASHHPEVAGGVCQRGTQEGRQSSLATSSAGSAPPPPPIPPAQDTPPPPPHLIRLQVLLPSPPGSPPPAPPPPPPPPTRLYEHETRTSSTTTSWPRYRLSDCCLALAAYLPFSTHGHTSTRPALWTAARSCDHKKNSPTPSSTPIPSNNNSISDNACSCTLPRDNPYPVGPRCFSDGLRCRASGTCCYGIS